MENQGTWSMTGNTLTTSDVDVEGTYTFSIEGDRLTLSSPLEFELPDDSNLTLEEVLKDIPDLELYFRRG